MNTTTGDRSDAPTKPTPSQRRTTPPLSAGRVKPLARIGEILEEPLPLPDLMIEVSALLTALAKATTLGRDGAGPLKPSQRAELEFGPDFHMPPVTVGGQSFPVRRWIAWEFREGGTLLRPETDFVPVNLGAEAVSLLFKPVVTELPRKASDVRTVAMKVSLKLELNVPGNLVGQTGDIAFTSEEVVLPQPGQTLLELPVLSPRDPDVRRSLPPPILQARIEPAARLRGARLEQVDTAERRSPAHPCTRHPRDPSDPTPGGLRPAPVRVGRAHPGDAAPG